MTFFRTMTRFAGISLCVVAFAGTAAAGNNGGGNGTERGNSAAAHEQKADRAQATATSESQSQAAASAAANADATVAARGQAKAQGKATVKAAVKATAKATAKAPVSVAVTGGTTTEVKSQAKAQQKTAHASAKAAKAQERAAAKAAVKASVAAKTASKQSVKAEVQSQSNGRSAEAQHHVIVCHRTGSNSNPYVVINIPTTAWSEAHSNVTGSHPPKNNRHDILLKDPASRPGSKDGFTKQSSCPAPAPAVVQTTVTQEDVCPNIAGMQTTVPAGTVKQGNGACIEVKADVTVQPTVVPQVAAVQAPAEVKAQVKAQAKAQAKAAKAAKPTSGVLGAVASAPEAIGETATSGTLPFTGIPLWVAVLLGSGLLLTGVALRRATQH